MEHLTANAAPAAKARPVVEQGRRWLVAPVTMIVPGVLAGSKGPLFYPPADVAASVPSWRDVPLVVYHPTRNGAPVSARVPGVLDASGVGVVRNPQVRPRDGALVGEGWFDEEKLRRVDNRVHAALLAGRPVELSTGLFTENVPAPVGAHHRGRGYTHVAKNYRPDHLAILPDQVGACSVNDGCGVLVNARKPEPPPQPRTPEPAVTVNAASASAGRYVAGLLYAAPAAHLLHLRTRSYAAHQALGELYAALPDLVDDLAEAYQGVAGVLLEVGDRPDWPQADPLEFVKALRAFADGGRQAVGPSSELQNMVDEVLGAVDACLYKLRFLA